MSITSRLCAPARAVILFASRIETTAGIALVATALALGAAGAASAHEFKLGQLELQHPWSRATPPGAKVGGGYVTIENAGDTPDRLVGATAEVAGRTEIHEMAEKNGVMTMRKVDGGIEVPAKGELALKPGGYHFMLFDLKRPLKQGEDFAGTLTFEKAGTINVHFAVESMGATDPGANAGSMGHDMGHDMGKMGQ